MGLQVTTNLSERADISGAQTVHNAGSNIVWKVQQGDVLHTARYRASGWRRLLNRRFTEALPPYVQLSPLSKSTGRTFVREVGCGQRRYTPKNGVGGLSCAHDSFLRIGRRLNDTGEFEIGRSLENPAVGAQYS